jgi:hypothetical protein
MDWVMGVLLQVVALAKGGPELLLKMAPAGAARILCEFRVDQKHRG